MTSTDVIVAARRALWEPDEIDEPEVTDLLGRLSAKDIDTAELFFQLARHEALGDWRMARSRAAPTASTAGFGGAGESAARKPASRTPTT